MTKYIILNGQVTLSEHLYVKCYKAAMETGFVPFPTRYAC